MSTLKTKKKWLCFSIVIFLHSICFFDYIHYNEINPTYMGRLSKLASIFLLCFALSVYKKHRDKPMSNYVMGFIFFPMLSFIPCYFCHNQSFFQSIEVYLPFFYIYIYYILHHYEIKEDDIVKFLTIIAVLRTGILFVEQFTYPHYLFAYRKEMEDINGKIIGIEQRNGIWRFYLRDTYLSMFLVFYYFQKLFENIHFKYILLFFIGVFGVYLDQTRQYMFSTFLSILLILFLYVNVKFRFLYFIIIFFACSLLYINIDYIFGDMVSRTIEDTNKDNIRLVAYMHYGLEYWDGIWTVLFGNGYPNMRSPYGNEISFFRYSLGLYQSDIGIVGMLSYYGVVSVICFFSFFYVIISKYWTQIEMHLKMFVLATIINLPLFTLFSCHVDSYPFWAFMLFLIDRSIKNKLKVYELN